MDEIIKEINLNNIDHSSKKETPKKKTSCKDKTDISGNVIIKKTKEVSVPSERIFEVVARQQRRLRKCFSKI
ncbi:MAG: hypothetical protein ACLFUI_02840 [Halanaerobiales bacterium]